MRIIENMTDSVLVAFDYEKEQSEAVLIVGRQGPNNTAEIINVFSGQEAVELWGKLTVMEGGKQR